MRIGNAAVDQLQLDVYGEVMDALYVALARRRRAGSPTPGRFSALLVEFLERAWQEPDEGIWEVRGPRRHFTHSKVMALGRGRSGDQVDRAVTAATARSTDGRALARRDPRAMSARTVSTRARTRSRSTTASNELDASLLMIPLVGFLPPETRASPARPRRSSAS